MEQGGGVADVGVGGGESLFRPTQSQETRANWEVLFFNFPWGLSSPVSTRPQPFSWEASGGGPSRLFTLHKGRVASDQMRLKNRCSCSCMRQAVPSGDRV